jgi:cyclophilin family peptidyl-prolyl cis-trans isomerase
MPSNRQTRDRQLAKLADRRRRERQRAHRNRMVITGLIVAVALGAAGTGLFMFVKGGKKPTAAPSATPTPSVTASPGVACGGTVPAAASKKKPSFKKPPKMTIDTSKTYTATMVTSCGTIVMKLDPKLAPNTVNSIVFLAKQHFYDGLTFHRIARDFVIQGGDPTGTGGGGPGYKTVDPPPAGTTYTKGVVAMAKAGSEAKGTAGSQFFIMIGANAGLPPDYAVVGSVLTGQDVADAIGKLAIQNGAGDGGPVDTVYLVKITIKES